MKAEINRFSNHITIKAEDVPQGFKQIRILRGLSLRELEKRSGISNPYLRQLENGKLTILSFGVVEKICIALGVTIIINP